jgi:hypothetical protein
MKVRVTFDINKARAIHLGWVIRIENILESGPEQAPCALPYYQNCELGIWLHGEGRTRYRKFEDIRRLVVEHRRFHHGIEHVLLAIHSGDPQKAQKLLGDVRYISKDIIYLLTLLELRTLEKQWLRQSGGGFFAAIGALFSPNVNWLEPPKSKNSNPSLDITYARLAHLRWASTLDQSFRNFGRGVSLQAHDSCEFGAWIQKARIKKYSGVEELDHLDEVHQQFHEAASRLIRHLQNRHLQRADEAYADVQILSREIAWLLTLMDYRLQPPPSALMDGATLGQASLASGPPVPAAAMPPDDPTLTAPVAHLTPAQAIVEHFIGV